MLHSYPPPDKKWNSPKIFEQIRFLKVRYDWLNSEVQFASGHYK